MDEKDYTHLIEELLPHGPAWTRQPDSKMHNLAMGLGDFFYYIHQRVEKAGREIFPRETNETLVDWERQLGLPETCIHGTHADNLTVAERVDAVIAKINRRFSPTRENFVKLARMLGYTVTIITTPPAYCGIARCGDRLGGRVSDGYYWITIVDGARIRYAQCGITRCGEPLCTIRWADDLACMLERIKPAHTSLKFSYISGDE